MNKPPFLDHQTIFLPFKICVDLFKKITASILTFFTVLLYHIYLFPILFFCFLINLLPGEYLKITRNEDEPLEMELKVGKRSTKKDEKE